MRFIMDKINPNILVVTLGIIAATIVGSVTILTINGTSADQITLVLGTSIGSITTLIASVATLSKIHSVKSDTAQVPQILNGVMDAKIVNGVKAALVDLGIIHTANPAPVPTPVAAPDAAPSPAPQVVDPLANKPTPDGGTTLV